MEDFYAVIYNRKYMGLVPQNLNLLFSAGYMWRSKRFQPLIRQGYTGKVFIDSGGYQFITKFKDYHYTPKQYIDYCLGQNPDVYASMDYPCEPEVQRKNNVTVKEQINKTIKNNITLLELNPIKKPMPVIQGWEKEDYVYCIDELGKYGLISDYMAIGSLCVRKNSVYPILKEVVNNLPSWVKLHGFGMKITNLKNRYMFEHFYSCDSMAWLFVHKLGRFYLFTGSRMIEIDSRSRVNDLERASLSLRAYLEYINHLSSKQRKQSKIIN